MQWLTYLVSMNTSASESPKHEAADVVVGRREQCVQRDVSPGGIEVSISSLVTLRLSNRQRLLMLCFWNSRATSVESHDEESSQACHSKMQNLTCVRCHSKVGVARKMRQRFGMTTAFNCSKKVGGVPFHLKSPSARAPEHRDEFMVLDDQQVLNYDKEEMSEIGRETTMAMWLLTSFETHCM